MMPSITLILAFLLYGVIELLSSKRAEKRMKREQKKELEQWERECPKTIKLIQKYYWN